MTLKNNTVITELNISDNKLAEDEKDNTDMSGVIAIRDAIATMEALAKLTFGGDGTYSNESTNWEQVPYKPATLEVGMKEADLSDKNLGIGGAIIVGAWISHKDNGALVSANLLNNKIGVEQAKNLATILKAHATLKSLCGNKGDETVLDMSGTKMGTDGAIMLVPEIAANGALTSLNIGDNNIPVDKMNEIIALATYVS